MYSSRSSSPLVRRLAPLLFPISSWSLAVPVFNIEPAGWVISTFASMWWVDMVGGGRGDYNRGRLLYVSPGDGNRAGGSASRGREACPGSPDLCDPSYPVIENASEKPPSDPKSTDLAPEYSRIHAGEWFGVISVNRRICDPPRLWQIVSTPQRRWGQRLAFNIHRSICTTPTAMTSVTGLLYSIAVQGYKVTYISPYTPTCPTEIHTKLLTQVTQAISA